MSMMLDSGHGPTVVLVPGVQGRWEWMHPTVVSLAKRCRVIAFSLAGEPGSGRDIDPHRGFDTYLSHIDEHLERAGVRRAVLCGVSYGGLIAVRYAAQRIERTDGLVLVSPVSPRWRPDQRIERYLRAPRLFYPVFCAQALGRFVSEIGATFERPSQRGRFALRHGRAVASAPMSPTRVSERIRLTRGIDFTNDCRQVRCQTLIVTGEPTLDRVVPVDQSLDYLGLIHGARARTIAGTGHLGIVTRPDVFAAMVGEFLEELGLSESTRAIASGPDESDRRRA